MVGQDTFFVRAAALVDISVGPAKSILIHGWVPGLLTVLEVYPLPVSPASGIEPQMLDYLSAADGGQRMAVMVGRTSPIAFVGSGRGLFWRAGAGYALVLQHAFAARQTGFLLCVESLSFGGRPSLSGQVGDFDFPLQASFSDLQTATDVDFSTGFRALALQVDVATVNRFDRQLARFVESCRP